MKSTYSTKTRKDDETGRHFLFTYKLDIIGLIFYFPGIRAMFEITKLNKITTIHSFKLHKRIDYNFFTNKVF